MPGTTSSQRAQKMSFRNQWFIEIGHEIRRARLNPRQQLGRKHMGSYKKSLPQVLLLPIRADRRNRAHGNDPAPFVDRDAATEWLRVYPL